MKSLNKLTKIVVLLIAIIAAILYIGIARSGNQSYIDYSISLTKFLLYFTAILALIVWILDIFSSKKSLVYTLISLGIFLLVILVAYMKASGEPYKLGNKVFSAGVSKWVDTGLYSFYILFGFAVILLFVSSLFGGFNFSFAGGAKKDYVEETEELAEEDSESEEHYEDEGDE